MKRRSADKWRNFYREESSQYDKRRYGSPYGRLFTQLHHEIIAERLMHVPHTAKILEIACGTGHATALLQTLGFSPFACDLTPEMMRHARARCGSGSDPTTFLQANAFCLPFGPGSIDVIITTRFLHLFHSHDQEKVLTECARVLRPQGTLIADFDNSSANLLMAIPHTLYNLVRYRRLAADSHYNSPSEVTNMLHSSGFDVDFCEGIAGTHLLPLAWASPSAAVTVGKMHRRLPFRILAQQFLVAARRR